MENNSRSHFVILSSQRSGSTWLTDSLNHLPKTKAFGELFLRPPEQRSDCGENAPRMSEKTRRYVQTGINAFAKYFSTPKSPIMPRPLRLFGYLNKLYCHPGAVGFKFMYNQSLEFPDIWVYMAVHRLRVIHLIRKNHLDVIISSEMRKTNKTVHSVIGDPVVSCGKIYLDPKKTLANMRALRRNISIARFLLNLLRIPHCEIVYEDLVRDPSCQFSRVCDFLSISHDGQGPRSDFVKLIKEGHTNIIDNYDEIKMALAKTEFSSLLD